MRTAMEILLPKLKEAEENEKKGLVCDNKLYIIQAMNEFTDQFKTDKLYEFVYCCMTEESSYATISVHRTREGAEKAMNEHKERCREEWKKKYPVGSYEPFPFGRFEDWGINETEVVD